jgi:hypothetical protein
MFEITLSTILTVTNIAEAFSQLIPDGLKIDVFPYAETPEEIGAIWAWIRESNDPAWPCFIDVIHYGDECELVQRQILILGWMSFKKLTE